MHAPEEGTRPAVQLQQRTHTFGQVSLRVWVEDNQAPGPGGEGQAAGAVVAAACAEAPPHSGKWIRATEAEHRDPPPLPGPPQGGVCSNPSPQQGTGAKQRGPATQEGAGSDPLPPPGPPGQGPPCSAGSSSLPSPPPGPAREGTGSNPPPLPGSVQEGGNIGQPPQEGAASNPPPLPGHSEEATTATTTAATTTATTATTTAAAPPHQSSPQQAPCGDELGLQLWGAASTLCAWLAARPQQVAGRRVLEVGAGVGLPGLLAAALGARHVLLTDYEPQVVALQARNIAANGPAAACCSAAPLDWTQPEEGVLRQPWEVVLAADVCYATRMARPLARMLVRLARPPPDGGGARVLLAHHVRKSVRWDREREAVVEDEADEPLEAFLGACLAAGVPCRPVWQDREQEPLRLIYALGDGGAGK